MLILKVLPLVFRPGEASALFNCYFCCLYCHNVEDSILYRGNVEYSMIAAMGLVRTLFDTNRMTQKMLCS